MNRFFKPYEGTRPFLFISYAHRQSEEVVSTIRILHEKGWRLWYDEGIPAGSDWPANIAQHMDRCERVIFFLSARAMESPNCYSEMRTAFRMKKPVLVVRLEDAEKDARWQEILAGAKTEIPITSTPEARADAILRSGFVTRRFHRSWTESIPKGAMGLIASLAFFLAAAGALGALRSGLWNPFPAAQTSAALQEETSQEEEEEAEIPEVVDLGEAERYFAVEFPDGDQERAIHAALGIPAGEDIFRGDLAELEELYLCGNMTAKSLSKVTFDEDGVCRVNGAPVIEGKVKNLSVLPYAVRLTKLGLICQPLGNISDLNSHVLLQELSLAGSTVEDIDALEDLPSLEVLHLEHTGVSDLSALDSLPRLKKVTVSRNMLPLSWSGDAGFAVVLVP